MWFLKLYKLPITPQTSRIALRDKGSTCLARRHWRCIVQRNLIHSSIPDWYWFKRIAISKVSILYWCQLVPCISRTLKEHETKHTEYYSFSSINKVYLFCNGCLVINIHIVPKQRRCAFRFPRNFLLELLCTAKQCFTTWNFSTRCDKIL